MAGWHWSPCAGLAGSTDRDDNCRNGSGRFAKDSIGTSRSAGCCIDCGGFLECWDAPEGSRKRKITISHDC